MNQTTNIIQETCLLLIRDTIACKNVHFGQYYSFLKLHNMFSSLKLNLSSFIQFLVPMYNLFI